MDKLKQLGIIFGITFLAELLYRLLGLPVPASVYGLLLLFLALQFRIIELKKIEEAGNFLLVVMPLLFIAPGVNLINIFGEVKAILWQALVLIFISTIVVTVITGKIADYVLYREARNERNFK